MSHRITTLFAVGIILFASLQLSGCATGTAALECGVETYNPTVMGALDSFEAAAIAIKLSNRVLLRTPLSEQDEWPAKLYGAPSGGAIFGMGLSLLGASQGVTIPTEFDKDTGFPRPTSAFYIFLKDRQQMLNKEVNRDDVKFFKGQPRDVFYRPLGNRKKETTFDENVYRNPLMAYGVVIGNKDEILALQDNIELTENGYQECDAFLRSSGAAKANNVAQKAACKDPTLKDETIKKELVVEKKGTLEEMEKNYGRLANKVYSASVAGADFSMAALTKITCAIVNGIRALPNIKNEFSGAKGAYNVVMILPRIKIVFDSLGIYKNNLGLQYTVYTTMYEQIKGTYKIKEDEPAKQARLRQQYARQVLAELEPRIARVLAGEYVDFSLDDITRLNVVAAMFPALPTFEQEVLTVMNSGGTLNTATP